MSETADPAGRRVGIEASVALFRAVCLDAEGAVVAKETAAIEPDERTLPQLTSFISTLKERFGPFDRVGVAVPGLVHRESGRVTYSAHIPEHSALDLAAEIADASSIKAFVENDANAAAYGELKLGAGRGSSNLFYATLGL